MGLTIPDTTPDTKKRAGAEVSVAQAAKKARLDAIQAASSSTSNSSPAPSTSAGYVFCQRRNCLFTPIDLLSIAAVQTMESMKRLFDATCHVNP